MHNRIVLKAILFCIKINIKKLLHVSVRKHHHQGAHCLILVKVTIVKMS